MEIRKLKKEEYSLLVDFLRDYWKANHSLVKSKQLMDFQHLDGDTYTFYAAIEDGKIYSLQGFIKSSLYDESLADEPDCWGAIWKTIPDTKKGELGLLTREAIYEKEMKCSMCGIALSAISKKINKLTGNTMGYMHQYYIANREVSDFKICVNPQIDHAIHTVSDGWHIEQNIHLDGVSEPSTGYRPRKTVRYFINKYLYHPIFKYVFWGIYHNEELVSIWAVRRITVDGASIFRITDVLGRLDTIPDLTENIQEILRTESCEYIDFLNYGIKPEVFKTIGFNELDYDETSTILPNYFEPYEQRNVKLDVAYKAKYDEYVVFKADGDQDRPNIL